MVALANGAAVAAAAASLCGEPQCGGCGHKKVKCFLSHHKEGEKSLPIVEVDFKYIKSNAKAVLSTLLLLLSVAYRLFCNLCKQIAMFYETVVRIKNWWYATERSSSSVDSTALAFIFMYLKFNSTIGKLFSHSL